MKSTLALFAIALGLLAFGCSKPHVADSAKFQGNWTGKENGADTPGTPTLALQGASLEFHGADTNEWYKGTFTVREETTPK